MTKTVIPRRDASRTMMKPQCHRLIADWLGFVKHALPGENRVISPVDICFHNPTTPLSRRRKHKCFGSITPGSQWKTQPNGLIADWHPRRMCQTHSESHISGQRHGPEEDHVPSPGQNYFHTSIIRTNRGWKQWFRGKTPPPTVSKPHHHWLIIALLGLV